MYALIRIRDYQRILKSLVFCNRGLTFLTAEIARVCGDEATSTPYIISRSANGNAPAFRGDKSLDLQQYPISDPGYTDSRVTRQPLRCKRINITAA